MNITVTDRNLPTEEAFKNCAPFIKYITKIDGTTTDDAEELDLVMPMYNVLEYSLSCSGTAGSFILKMKQLILMSMLQTIMILNLSSVRLNYWEIQQTNGANGILKNTTAATALK